MQKAADTIAVTGTHSPATQQANNQSFADIQCSDQAITNSTFHQTPTTSGHTQADGVAAREFVTGPERTQHSSAEVLVINPAFRLAQLQCPHELHILTVRTCVSLTNHAYHITNSSTSTRTAVTMHKIVRQTRYSQQHHPIILSGNHYTERTFL